MAGSLGFLTFFSKMPKQQKLSVFYPTIMQTWPPRTRRMIRLENEALRSRFPPPPSINPAPSQPSSQPSYITRRKPVQWIKRISLACDPGSIEDLRIERNEYYPESLPINEERWKLIVESVKSGDLLRLEWAQRALNAHRVKHFVKKSIK